MNKKFKIEDALSREISVECVYKLGHKVYVKITHLTANKYKVNFFLSGVKPEYVFSRELEVLGNYASMDFPTNSQIDAVLRERKETRELKDK